MEIKILSGTTKKPITTIGRMAGICWNSDTSDDEKNYKRGLSCLEKNHGRVLEFINVEMVIDGYSARVIREWYTHIGGAPTRLQASTRYIDYSEFDYVTPPSIADDLRANFAYTMAINNIQKALTRLEELEIPREDIAMLLPLGMQTKIVDKRNLRNIIDMSRVRLCKRAYWEYRILMHDVLDSLGEIDDEWSYIVTKYCYPRCKDCKEECSN